MEERTQQAHKIFSAWKIMQNQEENGLPVPFDLHLWFAKEGLLLFLKPECVSSVSVERKLSFISLVKLGSAE